MNSIILCGFMGAGKTSVGKELANRHNLKFIETDEYIEKKQNMTIKEIFEKYGEDYFRDLENEVTREISNSENCVVSTGGGLMTYKRNSDLLIDNIVIFLDASFERLENDTTRPLFQNIENAKKLYDKRKNIYKDVSNLTIDADGSIEECVKKIEKLIF